MLQGWVVIAVALAYISLLFVIASYGDRLRLARGDRPRMLIYPLSLAIYCTSWTFFGSVGLASRTGYDFLAIYLGPALVIGLCFPLIIRLVRLAKAHNITSIADFIAARYGKSQAVAATVALIAIIGTIPYIALQLKAVSASLSTVLAHGHPSTDAASAFFGDLSLYVALSMAAFAVLFGARHTDATEHQDGLMLAIATESIVKLFAFVAVGIFVTLFIFGGPRDLFQHAMEHEKANALLTGEPHFGTLLTMTVLSAIAILLLPRQFHVMVVENNGDAEIRRAAWMFPLYLVAINIFVLPIAIAGLILFPIQHVDSDMFVLALPMAAGAELLTLVAFIGGLSAATAMVIVESVALAIMVSNDIVMPFVLKRRETLVSGSVDVGALLLRTRRIAIFGILLLAYVYYRSAGDAQLAVIGLLSFAAIAQFAPAFFGGLIWRRATARGALAGMIAGTLAWIYTLLLPSFADAGWFSPDFVRNGPFGLSVLRPQALLWLDLPPLVHGVMWSLALNILAYIVFSLYREPAAIERVQAGYFVPSELAQSTQSFRLWRSSVTVEELTATVARYLGEERTRSSFASFAEMRRISIEPRDEADVHLLRHAEHLLASAIGTASSRLALSLLLRKRTVSPAAVFKMLDEASAAILYNREVLQTALDHVRQGIAVFDKELRLVCWNRQFGEIIDVPPARVRTGATLEDILRNAAERAGVGEYVIHHFVRERAERYISSAEPFLERFANRPLVIEVRTNRMPDGGFVTTLTDITASVEAAEALERSNETLERRVHERTEELTRLNEALHLAKADAEEANLSKTRFIAAASHDILQPLNAARLYVTSISERHGQGDDRELVTNADASLEAVEEILNALLDISRLDAGAMPAEFTELPIGDLMRQLELEFAPLAHAKDLDITFVACSLFVRSDRRLLRRLLQNLISNAVKYTQRGRVLVGCRRRGARLEVAVYDTGVGIPPSQSRAIFREFHRLDQGIKVARGLGLGLCIVERIAKVLEHKIEFRSEPGRGSHFWIEVEMAPVRAIAEAAAPAVRRTEPGRLDGMTVLCIDNQKQILEGMRTLLSGWGCRVLTATDLDGALTQLDPAHDALHGILIDYHLDDGNGIDAIAELRRRFGADLPAILITADRTAEVREAARALGLSILSKPVKPASLRALLVQWRTQKLAAAE